MNPSIKLGVLASIAGALMIPAATHAAVTLHSFNSNGVNYCQAFTPGPTNTIRNRVVGAENVGTALMNVACNFHSLTSTTSAMPKQLEVSFGNTGTAALTVTCTLLTSYQGSTTAYAVAKSVVVQPNTFSDATLTWSNTDNPTPNATTMGSNLIGINCALPPNGVINDTYLYFDMENGVGA